MEKFVLISEPRSGTTFFNSVVQRHPDIHIFGEILPGCKREQDFHHFWLKKIEEDPRHILIDKFYLVFSDYLDYLPGLCPDAACLGLDIKYYQAQWKFDMIEVLRQHGYKVVHLIRKNILKRHVSLSLHEPEIREQLRRGSHTSKTGQQAKISIPAGEQLIKLLAGYQLNIAKFSELLTGNFACQELIFEDILDESNNSIKQPVLDKLFRFLKVGDPTGDLGSDMRKLNPKQLRHSVSNYHEVVEALIGTEFQWMLDDPARDLELIPAYAAMDQGEQELMIGHPDKALDALAKAADLAPDLPDPIYLLGMLQIGSGHPAKGMETLKRGLGMTLGKPGHAYFDTMLRTTPMDATSRKLVDLLLLESETTT